MKQLEDGYIILNDCLLPHLHIDTKRLNWKEIRIKNSDSAPGVDFLNAIII
jgi:hypothetical protein